MKVIHWSGGVRIVDKRVDNRLKGWPVCCSGALAYRIKYHGMMNSQDPTAVTCKKCQALLRKAGKLP
jgi:hypothetical protein